MSNQYPFELPEKILAHNPKTKASHKAEVKRHISFPLILSILILVIVIYLMIDNRIGSVEKWSQISTIFLSSIALFIGLFVIVLLFSIIFGMYQLLRNLPRFTKSAQDAVHKVEKQLIRGAQLSVAPIKKIQNFTSQITNFFGSFSKKKEL